MATAMVAETESVVAAVGTVAMAVADTTTETAGAGNNQQNAVGVAIETAVMAAAIMAAWLQWQAGAAAWQK
jgi:hypothetical protein